MSAGEFWTALEAASLILVKDTVRRGPLAAMLRPSQPTDIAPEFPAGAAAVVRHGTLDLLAAVEELIIGCEMASGDNTECW